MQNFMVAGYIRLSKEDKIRDESTGTLIQNIKTNRIIELIS